MKSSCNHYLFLVHVEEMFRDHFPDEMYVNRLIRSCRAKKYTGVFLLLSGLDEWPPKPIWELQDVTSSHQYIEWGWGYEADMFDDEEDQWVIPSLGHEWTWVHYKIREMRLALQQGKVYVGGGYESECLQDFCECLDHLNIEYEKVRGLIY